MAQKKTFTVEVAVPEKIYTIAAAHFASTLDEYEDEPLFHFSVSSSKLSKALAEHPDFQARVRYLIIEQLQWNVDDIDPYDWEIELETYVSSLFPKEWEKAIAAHSDARASALLEKERGIAAAKLAKTGRRLQIFVPSASKGFTKELAALLEKYDGKLAEDLS